MQGSGENDFLRMYDIISETITQLKGMPRDSENFSKLVGVLQKLTKITKDVSKIEDLKLSFIAEEEITEVDELIFDDMVKERMKAEKEKKGENPQKINA